MKLKKTFFAVALIFSACTFSSCSSDKTNDTTGPIITLIAPENEDTFTRGEDIHVELKLEDESGLKSYMIDIHYEGDHTHSYAAADETEWIYKVPYTDIEGQKNADLHVHTEVIPETAKPGEYHFGIIALDIHGNETQKYIDIDIE
jgi:hypothetical protein